MARLVIETEDGRVVWRSPLVLTSHELLGVAGQARLVGEVRRSVQDAEAIEAGRDPERPSEKAMRMAEEAGAFDRIPITEKGERRDPGTVEIPIIESEAD